MKQFLILLLILPLCNYAQENVGIGIENPSSQLHLHKASNANGSSAIQLTNSMSGSTALDGLKIEINGLLSSIVNAENSALSLGSNNESFFNILPDETVGLNTTQMIGASTFTIRSKYEAFGGMYIESPNSLQGKPFYGYSLDKAISAYHYYDAVDQRFKFNVGNGFIPVFSFSSQGEFLMNTSSAINTVTDLTLRSKNSSDFGGMYIESIDGVSGKPFYGYAINGSPRAYHYYDQGNAKWALYVSGADRMIVQDDGNVGLGIITADEKLVVNGRIRLTVSGVGSAPDGTIVYNGTNFYGRVDGLWYKMTNATNGLKPHPEDDDIAKLALENEALRKKMDAMEKRLSEIEKGLEAKK